MMKKKSIWTALPFVKIRLVYEEFPPVPRIISLMDSYLRKCRQKTIGPNIFFLPRYQLLLIKQNTDGHGKLQLIIFLIENSLAMQFFCTYQGTGNFIYQKNRKNGALLVIQFYDIRKHLHTYLWAFKQHQHWKLSKIDLGVHGLLLSTVHYKTNTKYFINRSPYSVLEEQSIFHTLQFIVATHPSDN